jgi:hypothetical protein
MQAEIRIREMFLPGEKKTYCVVKTILIILAMVAVLMQPENI